MYAQLIRNLACTTSLGGCGFADFGIVLAGSVQFILELVFLASAVAIVYAGVRLFLSRGDLRAMSHVHLTFKRAGQGLLLSLGGWLIVNTVLILIAPGHSFFGGAQFRLPPAPEAGRYSTSTRDVAEVEDAAATVRSLQEFCRACDPVELVAIVYGGPGGGKMVEFPDPTLPRELKVPVYGEGLLAHADAYRALRAGGISVWSRATGLNNCLAPECGTSLDSMPGFVVERLLSIAADPACGRCRIIVTGGTESHSAITGGTSEHAAGHPVLDLEDDVALAQYLLTHWEVLGVQKILIPTSLQGRQPYKDLCQKTLDMGYRGCSDPSGQTHLHVVFRR